MRTSFTLKNLAASCVLAGIFGSAFATVPTQLTVTGSDGKRYLVWSEQTTFTAASSELQATPWWNNQTLANSLASAVNADLSGDNTDSTVHINTDGYASPFFAYQYAAPNVTLAFNHDGDHAHIGGVAAEGDSYYYVFGRLALNVLQSSTNQLNSPAYGAASIIDNNSSLQELFSDLSDDADVSAAATQTLPLLTGGSIQAVGNALNGINGVVQNRIQMARGQASGDGFVTDQYVWVKPFGSLAEQDDSNGVSGFEAKTAGLAVGADGALNDKLRLGAAFAYAKSDVDSNSTVAKQSAKVDVFQLIGYGSYDLPDNSSLNFQVDVGQNLNKGSRQIAFTGTVASSDYNSYSAHVGASLGRSYQLAAKTSLTPSIRADYTWIKDRGYSETGAGLLNLNVDSRDSEALVFGIDAALNHQISDSTSLSANLGVGYDSLAKQASITAVFAGAPGAAFTTYGLDVEPWSARAGLGLTHTMASGTEISLRYDAEHREGYLNQSASVKARWAF